MKKSEIVMNRFLRFESFLKNNLFGFQNDSWMIILASVENSAINLEQYNCKRQNYDTRGLYTRHPP